MNNKDTEITHTEAPRSANTRIKSKNGFTWQFTIREDTAASLLTDMAKLEKLFTDQGYTPVEDRQFGGGGFNKPKLPEKPCPIPGHQPLKERIRKDGSKGWSHSRGTYPNLEWCNGQGFPGEQQGFNAIANMPDTIPERDIQEDF